MQTFEHESEQLFVQSVHPPALFIGSSSPQLNKKEGKDMAAMNGNVFCVTFLKNSLRLKSSCFDLLFIILSLFIRNYAYLNKSLIIDYIQNIHTYIYSFLNSLNSLMFQFYFQVSPFLRGIRTFIIQYQCSFIDFTYGICTLLGT